MLVAKSPAFPTGSTKGPNDYVDLPEVDLSGWAAKEIIYVRISMGQAGSMLPLKIVSRTLTQNGDIATFLAGLKSSGSPSPSPWPPASSPAATPIDIEVTKPCYVVIELDDQRQWYFRAAGVGVTTKKKYVNTDDGTHSNANLRHVNPDWSETEGAPNDNGCRIVYFAVMARKDPHKRQSFNLHIELAQPSPFNTIEIAVDPDVPNLGGKFP